MNLIELVLSLLARSTDGLLLMGGTLVVTFLLLSRRPSTVARIDRFAIFLVRKGFGRLQYSTSVAIAVRILVGTVLVTRAALNLVFSGGIQTFEGSVFLLEIVAGLFLVLGLCTQWAVLFFVIVDIPVLVPATGWGSVSNDVLVMVLIALFLLQSGRTASLDERIQNKYPGNSFRRWFLYDWNLSERGVALVKFTALLTYGLLSFYSVTMHLSDPAWLNGSAGPLLLTNQFMSPLADEIANLAGSSPLIVHLLRISMWVQIAWFISLIWLPLVSDAGRYFTIAWGWVFFIASATALSLGFTAAFEILLWFLIFGLFPQDSRGHHESLAKAKINLASDETTATSRSPVVKIHITFFAAVILAGLFYLATIPLPFAPSGLLPGNLGSKSASLWGLEHIDVFNETDLKMRENIFVIRDKSSGQVLPVFNEDGSRGYVLSSPRNYFGKGLPIVRGEIYRSGCGIDRNSELIASLARDYYRFSNSKFPEVVSVTHLKHPSPSTEEILEGRYIESRVSLICEADVEL